MTTSSVSMEAGGASVDLRDLHAANIARQAEWCPDRLPDLSFRGNELAGEAGEASEALILHAAEISRAAGRASNVVKKLERERYGWRGSRATKDDLADELADMVICADLCAVTADIDLGAAVVSKFNATSEKQGLATRLPTSRAVETRSPIATAPLNREVYVYCGEMRFRAMLVPGGGMYEGEDGKEHTCDQWQATRDGEHPPCWSEGACWASNADEDRSLQPTHWSPVEPATPTTEAKP